MSRSFRTCWRLVALPFAVTACGDLPPPYSPDYVVIRQASPHNPRKVRKQLVPEACLTPDPNDEHELGEQLPPGCANAYNLQRMTEKEKDLVKGRKLGPAPAAPSARAAQKYLQGAPEGPLGGAVDTGPGPGSGNNQGGSVVSTQPGGGR